LDGLAKLQSKQDKPGPSQSVQDLSGDGELPAVADDPPLVSTDQPQPSIDELRKDSAIQDTLKQLQATGVPLTSLLNPVTPVGTQSGQTKDGNFFDPVFYLRPKATSKFLDILDFVNRSNKEQEDVISSRDGIEIVCRKAVNKRNLESVSLTQWNLANVQILYQLMSEGSLSYQSVPDYLAYTTKILELSFHFDWPSILRYDREYRGKQATYGFRWGTDPPHMSYAILIPKVKAKPSASVGKVSLPKFNKRPMTRDGKEICLAFNSNGGCKYGASCKFIHVCSEEGCEYRHARINHGKD
jgi:hypothetical protein